MPADHPFCTILPVCVGSRLAVFPYVRHEPCNGIQQVSKTPLGIAVRMIAKRKTMKLPRILVAASNHELRATLKHALERAAYAVEECRCKCVLRNALGATPEASGLERFDALLFDKHMLDERAAQLIRDYQRRERAPPLILITGWTDETLTSGVGLRVAFTISNPTDVTKCMSLVRKLAPHKSTTVITTPINDLRFQRKEKQ